MHYRRSTYIRCWLFLRGNSHIITIDMNWIICKRKRNRGRGLRSPAHSEKAPRLATLGCRARGGGPCGVACVAEDFRQSIPLCGGSRVHCIALSNEEGPNEYPINLFFTMKGRVISFSLDPRNSSISEFPAPPPQ